MATCREFTRQINDPRSIVNCGSCAKYSREAQRCKDEAEMAAGRDGLRAIITQVTALQSILRHQTEV